MRMEEIANTYLVKKVTHVVVTVPGYFNDAQNQASKDLFGNSVELLIDGRDTFS